MKNLLLLISLTYFFAGCTGKKVDNQSSSIIGDGKMPNLAKDREGNFHLVYGSGDSILYAYSSDALKFSKPSLISVLPHAYSFATRGPQIAAAKNGIIVTACTSRGDIYSFYKENGNNWVQGNRVNDADTIAKEGLMALGADGDNAFAVWLDLRDNMRNKIYGARSTDGGKTWSKNIMIYASPDTTVCECCKPSVSMKGDEVYVMFRNNLDGNRDLYLVHSRDGGIAFEPAKKLGNGSWALNGCPMDGGGLVINKNGTPETVWRRHNKVYRCTPGSAEIEIGEGRNCTMESENGKNAYAWTNNGAVTFLNPKGIATELGQGSLPIIKSVNDEQVICVWENEHKIYASVLKW